MDLQKIIREFLSIIDFKLCSFTDYSIIIQDTRNKDEFNKILILPIDYKSDDDLRIFRSSKLNNDCYSINVLNTKYPKIPFSKNGISWFNINIRKDKDSEFFSSELYHDDSLYITYIGNNYLSYRKCDDNGIIDIFYGLNGNNRYLEISCHVIPKIDRTLCLSETNSKTQHTTELTLKENGQSIYKQELKENEIDSYFHALAHKSKNIVEQANNGIRTLNKNIFEMVFEYHKIVPEFLNMIKNSVDGNKVINNLYEKYFNDIKMETEISHQRKLKLPDLRKNNNHHEE